MKKVLSRGLAMVMTSVIILTNVDVSAFAATNESIDKTMEIMDIQCPEDKEVSYGTQMENIGLPEELQAEVMFLETEEAEENLTMPETEEYVPESEMPETEVSMPETEVPETEAESEQPASELPSGETTVPEPSTEETTVPSSEIPAEEVVAPASEVPAEETAAPLSEPETGTEPEEGGQEETEVEVSFLEEVSISRHEVPKSMTGDMAQAGETSQETMTSDDDAEVGESQPETTVTDTDSDTVFVTETVTEVNTRSTNEEGHETEGNEEIISLPVTWNCDNYDEKTPGQYVFSAELKNDAWEGYTLMMAEGVSLPSVTVTVLEPQAVLLEQTVGNVRIILTAQPGVFPEDASLSVYEIVNNAEIEKIDAAVQEAVFEDENLTGMVAETKSFDITVLDTEGNELQPEIPEGMDPKDAVTVTFLNVELTSENADEKQLDVFYVDDTLENAEYIESEAGENEVSFSPEHFSTYTVVYYVKTASAIYETIPIDTNSLNGNAIQGLGEDMSTVKSAGGLDAYAAFYASTAAINAKPTDGGLGRINYTQETLDVGTGLTTTETYTLGSLTTDSGVPYIFSQTGENPYDGNDCIRLYSGKTTTTINLESYGSYEKIYVLGTAGGPGTGYYANFSVVLHYTDGTSETTEYKLYDWYDSAAASRNNGTVELYPYVRRKTLSSGTLDGQTSGGPYLQSAAINADPTKLLSSIDLVMNGKGNDATGTVSGSVSGLYCGVFAITGAKNPNVPDAPSAYAGDNLTTISYSASWSAVPGAIGYVIDLSEDRYFKSYVTGEVTTTDGTTSYRYTNYDVTALGATLSEDGTRYSCTIPGLKSDITYYYRVRAVNSAGQSVNSNVVSVILPSVMLELDDTTQLEIALALGSTKVDSSNFQEELTEALKKKGISEEQISFVEVDANASSQTSSFNWWVYDHTNGSSSWNDTTHQYLSNVNIAATQSTNSYNSNSRHIATSNNGATMDFYGYGTSGYKDFNYLPNTQATKKTIEFSITEGSAYDAFDGYGFLINSSITGSYNSNQIINGYLLFFQYNGSGKGTAIKLFQLTNVSTKTLHDGASFVFDTMSSAGASLACGTNGTIKLLATGNTSYGDYKYRRVSIEVMPTYIEVRYGYSSSSSSITLSDSNLVKWTYNGNSVTQYPLTAGYDASGEFRGGYGPLASYRGHNCEQLTHFTLSNLSMTAEYVRSLTEVVREPNWNAGKLSYLVNLNEAPIADFSDVYSTAEIINRLAEDDVTYIGWCGGNNYDDSWEFVNGVKNGSGLINVSNYGSTTTADYEYSKAARERQIEDIATLIINRLAAKKESQTSSESEINYYTYLTSDNFKFVPTGATLDDGNWSIGYSAGYSSVPFDTCSANISTYQDLASASFTTAGYYEVYYENNIAMPKARIRIHEMPVAAMTIAVDKTAYTITVNNNSYDPEFAASGDKGIESSVIEYRNLTTSADWTQTAPSSESLKNGETWVVRLTVTDHDGASAYTVQQISLGTAPSGGGSGSSGTETAAPYGSFRLNKTSYTKGVDETVTITDQSYALDGSTDFATTYTLKYGSTTKQTFSIAPQQEKQIALSGLSNGTYTVSMYATSADGKKKSETVTKNFTVNTGYRVSYDANGGNNAPASQNKIQGTTLKLSESVPSRSGYTFAGWSTTCDGAVEYTAGAAYTKNASVTLYAVWLQNMSYSASSYKGIYDGAEHGITISVTNPETDAVITYGTKNGDTIIYSSDNTGLFSKPGTYTLYFKITADGYQPITNSRTVKISKAVPVLTLADTTVSYSRTAAGEIDAATVTGVAGATEPSGEITYAYYTDAACTMLTDAAVGAADLGSAPQEAGTYYVKASLAGDDYYEAATSRVAVLNIEKYQVIFDMDGVACTEGTGPVNLSDQVKGDPVLAPTVTPVSQDYIFIGWYRDAKWQTEWNFDTDTIEGNTIIYAKWKAKSSYEASWQVGEDGEKKYGTLKEALAEPVPEGEQKKIVVQNDNEVDDLLIPEDTKLTVDKGVNLKLTGDTKVEGELENKGTIENEGTLHGPGEIDNTDGTITGGTIDKDATVEGGKVDDATNNGTITGSDVGGNTTNNGIIEDSKVGGNTTNNGTIKNSEVDGDTTNNGVMEDSTVKGDVDNRNGSIRGGTIGKDGTVKGGKVDNTTNNGTVSESDVSGDTINNGIITGSNVDGNTTNNGTITGSNVSGNTTNNGTISDSKVSGNTINNGTITDSEISGTVENENGCIQGGIILQGATINGGRVQQAMIYGRLVNVTIAEVTAGVTNSIFNAIAENIKEDTTDLTTNSKKESRTIKKNDKSEMREDAEETSGFNSDRSILLEQTKVISGSDEIIADYGNGSIKLSLDYTNEEKGKAVEEAVILSDAEAVIRACLSEEELQLVYGGENAEIKVNVIKVVQQVGKKDAEAIETFAQEEIDGWSFGNYLDISVVKKVGDSDWIKMSELNDKIQIQITIPQEILFENAVYAVIRCHNGKCTILEDQDETFETITIDTDKFSTYAVWYQLSESVIPDAPEETDHCAICGICSAPFGICIFLWIALSVMAIAVIVLVCAGKTNRKKQK